MSRSDLLLRRTKLTSGVSRPVRAVSDFFYFSLLCNRLQWIFHNRCLIDIIRINVYAFPRIPFPFQVPCGRSIHDRKTIVKDLLILQFLKNTRFLYQRRCIIIMHRSIIEIRIKAVSFSRNNLQNFWNQLSIHDITLSAWEVLDWVLFLPSPVPNSASIHPDTKHTKPEQFLIVSLEENPLVPMHSGYQSKLFGQHIQHGYVEDCDRYSI